MVFLDASAMVSLLTREDDAADLGSRMARSPKRATSPIAIFEATMAVARKLDWTVGEAHGLVLRLLSIGGVEIMPIGSAEAGIAVSAQAQFGKGRHAAGLNMGDCFAYACAKSSGAALLFKGDDFGLTDVEIA